MVATQVVACGDVTDIVGFDRVDGHVAWRYRPTVGPYPGVFAGTIDSARATIYAPTQTATIHAIDAQTGQAKWITELPQPTPPSSLQFSKVVDGGDVIFAPYTVFVGAHSGGVVSLRKSDGSIRWNTTFSQAAPDSSAGAKDVVSWRNLVIASIEDGRVVALNREDGSVVWTLPGVGTHPPDWPGGPGKVGADLRTLSVSGSVLLVASGNSGWVVLYDLPTHTELWRSSDRYLGAGLFDVTADASVAFITSFGGSLFAVSLGARTLTPLIRASEVTAFTTPPVLAPDRILLGSRDGYYAIRR